MRTIVHLSDLHFGATDDAIMSPLRDIVRKIGPDLIAVSGDLTQRARTRQFQAAREFLDALPKPQLIVPGNHDIPAYNLFSRFFHPLDKYRRYITAELRPFYADEELAIVGVNTARSWTIKGGRINTAQVAWIIEKLGQLREGITKIVISHHPFELPPSYKPEDLVGRSRMAMELLASNVDIFLAGHLHFGNTGQSVQRLNIQGNNALIIQAGTATSYRMRGETNSFNVIRIDHPSITVERLQWVAETSVFNICSTERFLQTKNIWSRK